jgi:hypothetical protein
MQREGYHTLEQLLTALNATEWIVRRALKELELKPVIFRSDRRVKWYTDEQLEAIRAWLESTDPQT